MKEQVTWLKDALDSKGLVEHLAYYLIHDGRLHATTGKMTASIPFPYHDGTLLLSGKEFEQVIKAAPKDPVLEVTDGGRARVRAGRFRAYIPVLDPEKWPLETPFEAFTDLPAGFLEKAALLRPFMSENATRLWTTCLAVSVDGLWATDNILIGHAPLPIPDLVLLEGALLLPSWAVDFILGRQEGLKQWGRDEGAAYFAWENGGRMKTSIVTEPYPIESIKKFLAAGSPSCTINEEWRASALRLASLAGNEDVTFYKDSGSFGQEGELFVEDGMETPTPEGGFSVWSAPYLSVMLKMAETWDPTAWPQPAAFAGKGVFGVLAARRK